MRTRPVEAQDTWVPGTADYVAAHQYVRHVRGDPQECENCGAGEGLEWSNPTKQYHDTESYEALCRSCHRRKDKAPLFPCGHPRVADYTTGSVRRCYPCRLAYQRKLYAKQKANPIWWAHRQGIHQKAHLKSRTRDVLLS